MDPDPLITALAAAIDLPIDPQHRPAIATNLIRLLAQSKIVMSVPIPPETEPAPIFRP